MANDRVSKQSAGSVMPDLDQTVHQASRGDQNAFIKLWKWFYPRILKFLFTLTKEAEDLCSEVWIKVAAAIKGYPGDGAAFTAWLYTIARNHAIDHLRQKKRRGSHTEIQDSDWVGEDQRPSDVTDLLRNLKSEEAEIISLRVVAGFDVPAVAQITGKS